MTLRIIPAIMSGGAGTRLWPLSTEDHPKQFHALMGPRTMFAETVARMSEENSFAAKNTAQVAEELDQLADALRQTAGRFKV